MKRRRTPRPDTPAIAIGPIRRPQAGQQTEGASSTLTPTAWSDGKEGRQAGTSA